jgi:carbon monoxide dehydrogenase subunit G
VEYSGEIELPAPMHRVRAVLQDPEVLGRLVPSSREMRPVGPGRFEGEVVIGLPPLGARYPVSATASEGGGGLRLHAVGVGRAEGMELQADCRIAAAGAGTHLHYRVRLELGALGRWVPAWAAQRAVHDFLDQLRREVEPARGGGRG